MRMWTSRLYEILKYLGEVKAPPNGPQSKDILHKFLAFIGT